MLGCLLAASWLALGAALTGGHAAGGDLLLARRRLGQGPLVGQSDEADEATLSELESMVEEELSNKKPGQDEPAAAEYEAAAEADTDDVAVARPATRAAPTVAASLPTSDEEFLSTAYEEVTGAGEGDQQAVGGSLEDRGGISAEAAAGSGYRGAGASAEGTEGGSAQEDAAGGDDDINLEFERWMMQKGPGGMPKLPRGSRAPSAREVLEPTGSDDAGVADPTEEEEAPRKRSAADLDEGMRLKSVHHEVTAEEEFLQNAAKKATDGRDRAMAEAAHNKEIEADALQRKRAAEQMIKEVEQKRQHALKIAAETAHAEKVRGEEAAAEAIEHTAAYQRQVKKGKQEHEELARARGAKQRFAGEYQQIQDDMERLKEQANAQKAVRASAAAEAAEERKLADRVGSVLGEAQKVDGLKEAAREMAAARKQLEGEFRRRAPFELDDHDFEGGILGDSDLEFEIPAIRRKMHAGEMD